jgi:hypothetical protein
VAKATNEVKQVNESRADAALSPRFTPASARREAGISAIPYRHWHGRFTELPAELQQVFMPLLRLHLERLQRGEILRTEVFVPKVGVLEVKWKGDEVWASFVDTLQWAYQILQQLRLFALALRHRTFSRSPEGGLWVWLPRQLILPPDCRSTLFCVKCQTTLMKRSPPPWKQNDHLRRKTDEAPLPLITNLWFDAAKPRALRAPNFCAAHRGGSGRLGLKLEPLTG